MAQLRWDQVSAPNFNGAIQGIESANRMIGGGLGNMADALSQFGDRQALEQLARYTDAQQLQRDLQSGAFNTGNASAEALKTIMGRPANLLSNTQTQQTIDHNDVMNPLNQQYQQLLNKGKQMDLDHNTVMNPLNQHFQRLLNKGSQMDLDHQRVMDPLRQADARLSSYQGYLSHNRSEAARARGLAIGQRWHDLTQNQAVTPEVAAAFHAQFAGDPEAHAEVGAMLAREVPGYGKAIVLPSLGSISGASGVNLGSGGGSSGVPSGNTNLNPDQIFDSLLLTESNGKQFNNDGSVRTSPKGATGIAQVMPATGPEAAELAGLPWDPQRFETDAEYNKSLGKAYFNKQLQTFGNDPAKALAAYNAGPGATQKAIARANAEGKPNDWLTYLPQETQDYVPKTLGRIAGQGQAATPEQVRLQAQKANQDSELAKQTTQLAAMVSNPTLVNRMISAGRAELEATGGASNESASSVAGRLIEKNPAFSKMELDSLKDAIQMVVQETGVSPAVAATMLEDTGEKGFWWWEDDRVIDKKKVGQILDSIVGKPDPDTGIRPKAVLFKNLVDAQIKNNTYMSNQTAHSDIQAKIKELEQQYQSAIARGNNAGRQAAQVIQAELANLYQKQEKSQGTTNSILNAAGVIPATPPPVPTPPPEPAPVATRPGVPANAVSPGSGNTNAVRGLDYSAAQRYWENQNRANASAREEAEIAEAARKAQEAKAEMERRIKAAQQMKKMFPETTFYSAY